MFSGGLDSSLIAAVACQVLPPEIDIDLVNVSFAPDSSADRFTAIFSYHDLKKLNPERNLRLLCADYSMDTLFAAETFLLDLCKPKQTLMDFNIAASLHYASKGEGYLFDTSFFDTEEYSALLDKLENKAGSTQKKNGKPIDKGSFDYGVITNKISSIDPKLYYDKTSGWTVSQSKVVFSGLGADEVWAGYSRYKTAGIRGGIGSLKSEMSLDLDRLWHRNMGRDDRAISVNGKETRFPFLDREIQSFLAKEISDLNSEDGQCTYYAWGEQRGQGDKRLLRQLSSECFGLNWASKFEKRAIHFGSKIAKQINVRKFGSNRKANGKAKYSQNEAKK